MTAADEAIDKYRMLNQAPGFKKAMLDQKHSLETEFAQMPGAPAAGVRRRRHGRAAR